MPTTKTSAEIDPVTHWAEEVANGKIVQGPHIRNAAARHLRDLENGKDRGLVWDLEEAKHRIQLFPKYLRLNGAEFEGRPFHLHPSQQFRIGSLYGWRFEDGERRFRKFYDEEAKGNGKSPMLAGLGYMGMVFDARARAEIYAAGRNKDQAYVLFRDAVAMRELSPDLQERVSALGKNPVRELVYRGRNGDLRFFKPISSDAGKSGPRPYVALIDEVHEHRNGELVDMMARGLSKHAENSLMAMATNSGHDRTSFCFEEHLHAIKVAAGDIEDDRLLAFVCSLDPGDDWLNDESCWCKPNPLLDVTIKTADLRDAVKQAIAIPSQQNNVARLHFCVWTEAHTVWISRELVEKAIDRELAIDALAGRKCYATLDLGARYDMTGLGLIFEDGVDDEGRPKAILWARGYTPAQTLIEREHRDQAPYSYWVREGYLKATPGNKVRLDHVAHDLRELSDRFQIELLAYDNWSFDKFADEMRDIGLELKTVQHAQGVSRSKKSPFFMPESISDFEDMIYEGRLRIIANPALISAIMSATFYETATGHRRFTKSKETARIDLAVSAAMCAGVFAKSHHVERTPPSPWEDENFKLHAEDFG
ncbi:MAG: terminase TerL endonuclease subunit [Pseudomonadota bacterium]